MSTALLIRLLGDLAEDKRAATAIEYALLAALAAIAAIGGLTAYGDSANDMYQRIVDAISTALA